MPEATLLAKASRLVTRDELDSVEAPPPTSTWFPLKHGHVLATVEQTLNDGGFSILSSELALSANRHRFFGTLTLGSQVHDGVALAIGVRNSTDKSFPIELVAGSRVFVCDNLSFSSEIFVSRKHTRFGQERFNEGIVLALPALSQFQAVEAARISRYRETPLDEDRAAACLLHAFEQGILSTRTLPQAIDEWRHPTLTDFSPRTAWSLFNCFTAALKERQGTPAFASLTMRLYGLLDREANYTLAV